MLIVILTKSIVYTSRFKNVEIPLRLLIYNSIVQLLQHILLLLIPNNNLFYNVAEEIVGFQRKY